MNITPMAQALDNADFVLFEGVVFETEYLRVPDEDTRKTTWCSKRGVAMTSCR